MSIPCDYDVTFDPNPIPLTLTPTIDDKSLKVTITDCPNINFHFTVDPNNDLLDTTVSTILAPIAELLVKNNYGSNISSFIKGMEPDPITLTTSYSKDGVTVTAKDLVLGYATVAGADMLKINCTLSLSTK